MAKRNRILLMNGCSVSEPSVFPKNWQSGGIELLKMDWRIQYYYHDPEYSNRWPKGKLCVIKGMNEFKSLRDRRDATAKNLSWIKDKLYSGWNPITKIQMTDHLIEAGVLHPDLPFIDAFNIALDKLDVTDRHRNEVGLIIKRVEKSARKLRMRNITIDQLKRRDLKRVLQHVGFTPHYFNSAKKYISSLFVELIEDECCDVNLARDIRRQKVIKKPREVMTVDHFHIVMSYLKDNHYEFWRYAQIFLYSGGRSTELLELKKADVDVDQQEFTVTIRKGAQAKVVTKVILPEVLHLWKEVVDKTNEGHYLFSKGLIPGPEKIRNDQIGKRWYRHVKKSKHIKDEKNQVLKITADFYTLKHTMLDSLPTELAQKLASHTSMQTTAIYQVNKEKRDREELKKLRIVV